MAEPARQIRNVETNSPEVRPRDAAIRKAAIERERNYERYTAQNIRNVQSAANDNGAYPTVDQSFVRSAEGRTIQPTLNQVTRGAQVNEGGATRTSTKTSNSTRSVKTQSRTARPARRPGIKRFAPNVPVLDVNAVSLVKGTTVSITNISWGIGLWLSFQLPLAILAVVFMGMAYIIQDVVPNMIKDATGELIYEGLSYIYSAFSDGVAWLLDKIFGFDLTEIANPENYFILTNFLVFIIGFSSLFIMAIIYQISLINCIFGKHSALKISTLIFATFAYMVPLLNIIPWFIFWVLVVWRYPE